MRGSSYAGKLVVGEIFHRNGVRMQAQVMSTCTFHQQGVVVQKSTIFKHPQAGQVWQRCSSQISKMAKAIFTKHS